jgi:hypothetical protein
MSNPLFGMLTGQMQMNPMLQKFNQFRQMFKGDPQQQVQQMLNSGKISQAQYNQAVQMANQVAQMMGIR